MKKITLFLEHVPIAVKAAAKRLDAFVDAEIRAAKREEGEGGNTVVTYQTSVTDEHQIAADQAELVRLASHIQEARDAEPAHETRVTPA